MAELVHAADLKSVLRVWVRLPVGALKDVGVSPADTTGWLTVGMDDRGHVNPFFTERVVLAAAFDVDEVAAVEAFTAHVRPYLDAECVVITPVFVGVDDVGTNV